TIRQLDAICLTDRQAPGGWEGACNLHGRARSNFFPWEIFQVRHVNMKLDIIVSEHGKNEGVSCTLDLNQFMDSPTGEQDIGKVIVFMADYLPKTSGPEGKVWNVPIE